MCDSLLVRFDDDYSAGVFHICDGSKPSWVAYDYQCVCVCVCVVFCLTVLVTFFFVENHTRKTNIGLTFFGGFFFFFWK